MTSKAALSPRRHAFVAAMAAGMTQAEAAARLGVLPRTCRRWYADPLVRAAIVATLDENLGHLMRRMSAGTEEALEVLGEVMRDGTMLGSVRIRAAQVWLDTSFRVRELLDLAARVTALEEAMGA